MTRQLASRKLLVVEIDTIGGQERIDARLDYTVECGDCGSTHSNSIRNDEFNQGQLNACKSLINVMVTKAEQVEGI